MPNIIVVGSTPVNRRKTVEALDLITEKAKGKEINFVLPLLGVQDSDLPKIAEHIASYVLSTEGTFKVTAVVKGGGEIIDGSTLQELDDANLLEIVGELGPHAEPIDYALTMIKKPLLLAVWDDEDAEVAEAVSKALMASVPARDITNDLEPIVIPSGEADEPTDEEQEEEEPAEEDEEREVEPGSLEYLGYAIAMLVDHIVARVKEEISAER